MCLLDSLSNAALLTSVSKLTVSSVDSQIYKFLLLTNTDFNVRKSQHPEMFMFFFVIQVLNEYQYGSVSVLKVVVVCTTTPFV